MNGIYPNQFFYPYTIYSPQQCICQSPQSAINEQVAQMNMNTRLQMMQMEQCISSDYCKGWNAAVDAIGRCKDCVWSREPTKKDYTEIGRDVIAYKNSLVCEFCEDARWKDDFCSYFKKRED